MAHPARAPEIPPHNQDIPIAEEIENFEDPVEDPVHIELDRILLRMFEDDENAPDIPPYVEDIPLIEDILQFIDIPIYLEIQEDLRQMEPDQNVPEVNIEDPQAFPQPLFFEPQELHLVDVPQEAAVAEPVNVFAMPMVENEPQAYQELDVMQQDMPAARGPEWAVVPPQEEEAVREENLNGQNDIIPNNERKRKAAGNLKPNKDNKKCKHAAGDE